MKPTSVILFKSNPYYKKGFRSNWKVMLDELFSSFELGLRLFKRDFAAKYKQSALGVSWVILTPLYTTVIFFGLKLAGVLNVSDTGVPYPLFAILGITIWGLMTNTIVNLSASVNASASLLSKINFPRISLAYSPVLTSLLDFSIQITLILFGMLIFGIRPSSSGLLLLPILIIPLMLMAVGIGLILSLIGAVVKDATNSITMVLNLLLYMTPIFYPMPKAGTLREISMFNPFAVLVCVPRDIFFYGNSNQMLGFLVFTFIAFLIFLVGWRFYHVALSRIVEKI